MKKNSPEFEDSLWNALVGYLVGIESEKELNVFLSSLLGRRQKLILAKRLAILLMLCGKRSYRQIMSELDVSPSVIRSIRRSFAGGIQYKTWREVSPKKHGEYSQKEKSEFSRRLNVFLTSFLKGKTDSRMRWRFLHEI